MTQFPLLVTIREANFFLAFKMSLFLPKLECKKDIDEVIKSVVEKVVVLRFGRDEDSVCLQLDEIVSRIFDAEHQMAAQSECHDYLTFVNVSRFCPSSCQKLPTT